MGRRSKTRKTASAETPSTAQKAGSGGVRIYFLYLLLALSIILYIYTRSNPFVAVIAIALFIVIILSEFRASVSQTGVKSTLYELVIAVAGAFLIVWFIPSIVLGTSTPIDVVVSCSMLPVLHRGDIVVVHGISNMSEFLDSHKVPVVNVSKAEFDSMLGNMSREALYPYALNNTSLSYIIPNASGYRINYYNEGCISNYLYLGDLGQYYGRCVANTSYQSRNLVRYNYSLFNVEIGGSHGLIISTSSITIGNRTIIENYSNPVIVYGTTQKDPVHEDIIHRVFAAIRVGPNYYLLTKGDNNNVLDMESSIYPANATDVKGYVIADVPLLGYPSLILKGEIGSNLLAECNQTILH